MSGWEDATPYSRGDTERIPRWWRIRVGDTEVSVGNQHVFHGDVSWLLVFDKRSPVVIGAVADLTEADAKRIALERVLAEYRKRVAAIRKVLAEDGPDYCGLNPVGVELAEAVGRQHGIEDTVWAGETETLAEAIHGAIEDAVAEAEEAADA